MEYYDLVLGSIPASILSSVGVLYLIGIGVMTGVLVGATLAALLILHALFVRTPDSPVDGNRSPSGSSYQSAD